MNVVLIILGAIVSIVIVLAFLVDKEEAEKREAAERKEKAENDSHNLYALLIGILNETGYCAHTIPASVYTGFVIMEDGSSCYVNPFADHDYSQEQLKHIIRWFVHNEQSLWEDSYYQYMEDKKRVKWCLEQIIEQELED